MTYKLTQIYEHTGYNIRPRKAGEVEKDLQSERRGRARELRSETQWILSLVDSMKEHSKTGTSFPIQWIIGLKKMAKRLSAMADYDEEKIG